MRVAVFAAKTHRAAVETKLQLLVGQKRELDERIEDLWTRANPLAIGENRPSKQRTANTLHRTQGLDALVSAPPGRNNPKGNNKKPSQGGRRGSGREGGSGHSSVVEQALAAIPSVVKVKSAKYGERTLPYWRLEAHELLVRALRHFSDTTQSRDQEKRRIRRMEKARLAAERAAARAAEEALAIDMNQPIPEEAFLWVEEEEERLRHEEEEERLSVVRFAEATATAAALEAAAAEIALAAAAAAAEEEEKERERLAQWNRRKELDREAEELENARILAEVVTTEKMTLKAKEEEEERVRLLRVEEEEKLQKLLQEQQQAMEEGKIVSNTNLIHFRTYLSMPPFHSFQCTLSSQSFQPTLLVFSTHHTIPLNHLHSFSHFLSLYRGRSRTPGGRAAGVYGAPGPGPRAGNLSTPTPTPFTSKSFSPDTPFLYIHPWDTCYTLIHPDSLRSALICI